MVDFTPPPRRDPLTWCAAGLVATPAALFVLVALHTIATWPPWIAGPASIGMFFGVPVSVVLLGAEYLAVVRRSRGATRLVVLAMGYFTVLGLFPWLGGLLDVLHLKRPNRRSMDSSEFVTYSLFWAGVIVAWLGHWRWYRQLDRWQARLPVVDPGTGSR